ncbi:hypothetical protein MERGE_002696 [Pneumocystis wakefieldiae]|uniref:rRNA-processing protein FYV7 n=1 Tax=Pneumocystis wakefieldiae TaxID=38082 RepID=A0A899FY26_9ASCO|nr:hypothetical protein MERGE_002696 [Pneumocystis wakefieldiae]
MIYQARARHDPAKIKRIHEYSYRGKLEKNRKKNIYIARLKKNYLRCLKEYEQKGLKEGRSSKNYCPSPSDTGECLFSEDQASNKEYKSGLSLNKKQEKLHDLKEKERNIQEEKYLRAKNRLKRYKIMTQKK